MDSLKRKLERFRRNYSIIFFSGGDFKRKRTLMRLLNWLQGTYSYNTDGIIYSFKTMDSIISVCTVASRCKVYRKFHFSYNKVILEVPLNKGFSYAKTEILLLNSVGAIPVKVAVK